MGAPNIKNYETVDLVKIKVAQAPLPIAAEASPAGNLKDKSAQLGRRRVPRRSFDSDVGVLLHGEYNVERAFQVGEGGMMIASSRPLAVGEMLVVSFYLPSSNTIIVRGIVRSIVNATSELPERYGIEFAKLNFQYKREIRNYVASAI